MSDEINVVITGAAGQIAYSLIFNIIKGDMFGLDQKIRLVLLDLPAFMENLKGVIMEIEDCAYPLVTGIIATTDVNEAFTNAHYAILVGAMPRKEGMERSDLLKANAAIFKVQGKAINDHANKNIKVLVVGNPANTNCLIAMLSAGNIPKENFSCLTRLDHNRAKSQIALKAGVNVKDVHNVIIWGNHSTTQYPDVRCGYVNVSAGVKSTIPNIIKNEAWLQGEFISTVQKRGGAVIAARKFSSAASAAKAITDHMRDWVLGTPEGEYVSMGVHSDGSYGIPAGLIFSFPVTIKSGKYTIVQGLPIDTFSREKLDITLKELQEEKDLALSFLEM
ncbi:malate dehydrogenase [Tieghemostelium lacteum]|uniref:Malate dehydrogenase n=1 Tax=Tieghemostelium lacteum TaxID=361077 RepID=A0A151ZDH8_TIELA|nr:malate dehydrogenase [Tieghemostelium lacteum]|eukprot:KYQ92018.1 malate dehydrogenase [Tieghemostelium lacteum]